MKFELDKKIEKKLLKLGSKLILEISGGLVSGLYYTLRWSNNTHIAENGCIFNHEISINHSGPDINPLLVKLSESLDKEIARQEVVNQIDKLKEKYPKAFLLRTEKAQSL